MAGPGQRTRAASLQVEGPAVTFRLVNAGGERLTVAEAGRTRRKRPAILILPGLYQAPAGSMGWLFQLARGGAVAASFADPVRMDGEKSGARAAEGFAGSLDRVVNGLVARASAALEALVGCFGADPGRIGVIGVSVGGWAALRLAEGWPGSGTARPLAVAAVLSGAGWRRVPEAVPAFFAQFGVHVPEGEAGAPVDPERHPSLHPGEAAARAGRLAGKAVLLVAGGQDPLVDAGEVEQFYRALASAAPEAAERLQIVVYPKLGHQLTPPMQDRVASWMLWMLGAGGI